MSGLALALAARVRRWSQRMLRRAITARAAKQYDAGAVHPGETSCGGPVRRSADARECSQCAHATARAATQHDAGAVHPGETRRLGGPSVGFECAQQLRSSGRENELRWARAARGRHVPMQPVRTRIRLRTWSSRTTSIRRGGWTVGSAPAATVNEQPAIRGSAERGRCIRAASKLAPCSHAVVGTKRLNKGGPGSAALRSDCLRTQPQQRRSYRRIDRCHQVRRLAAFLNLERR